MDTYQRRLRWSSILVVGVFLFWLPIEDINFIAAILIGAAICLLGALAVTRKQHISVQNYRWVGLLSGLCIGPVSVLLLIFKIGLHGHNIPDFTLEQLTELVKVSPVWGLAGFLMGLSVQFYLNSRRH